VGLKLRVTSSAATQMGWFTMRLYELIPARLPHSEWPARRSRNASPCQNEFGCIVEIDPIDAEAHRGTSDHTTRFNSGRSLTALPP
jgi:hypothetical protein